MSLAKRLACEFVIAGLCVAVCVGVTASKALIVSGLFAFGIAQWIAERERERLRQKHHPEWYGWPER